MKCVSGYHHGFIIEAGLMAKNTTKADALLDDLLNDCEAPADILGEHGLLKGLTKRLVERALQAELPQHLGYVPHVTTQATDGMSAMAPVRKRLKRTKGP